MKITSKVILWVITTILFTIGICCTFGLFSKLFPFTGFAFAIELHFILMAWFAFTIPKLKLKYNFGYFNSHKFEKSGAVYNYLGINFFRKLLVIIGWERVTNIINPKVKYSLKSLSKREFNSRSGEFAHLIIAIIVLITTFFITDSLSDAKWLIITNILLHIYPIFLQRYNRPRYLTVINKIKDKNCKTMYNNTYK